MEECLKKSPLDTLKTLPHKVRFNWVDDDQFCGCQRLFKYYKIVKKTGVTHYYRQCRLCRSHDPLTEDQFNKGVRYFDAVKEEKTRNGFICPKCSNPLYCQHFPTTYCSKCKTWDNINNIKMGLYMPSLGVHMGEWPANASGYRGVYLDKRTNGTSGRYQASIVKNGVRYRKSGFVSSHDAAAWYNVKAKELYGEHAFQNDIRWGQQHYR